MKNNFPRQLNECMYMNVEANEGEKILAKSIKANGHKAEKFERETKPPKKFFSPLVIYHQYNLRFPVSCFTILLQKAR